MVITYVFFFFVFFFYLLYNNGMLMFSLVLGETILMRTHNVQFHDKIRKCPIEICFVELPK